MTNISIKQGESLKIGFIFNSEYDETRINDLLLFLDGTLIGRKSLGTLPKTTCYSANMSSDDTFVMDGYRDLILVLDDSEIGIRKFIIAGITFIRLPDEFHADVDSNGYNLLLELNVNETTLSNQSDLIEVIRGPSGSGVLPNGGTTGQTIIKNSDLDQDVSWGTPPQINADWNSTVGSSKILNKPTIPAAQVQTDWNATSGLGVLLNKPTIVQQVNSDWNSVSGISEILNKPSHLVSYVNGYTGVITLVTSDIQDSSNYRYQTDSQKLYNDATSSIQTQLNLKESLSNKGVANGYVPLDSNSKIEVKYLPSYVDQVLEFESISLFPAIGEADKIYVDTTTNIIYRWGGTIYVIISDTIALGETSSTAYRGDRGKIAYDHSLLVIGNPHNVTKTDIGLGLVPNIDTTNDYRLSNFIAGVNYNPALPYPSNPTGDTFLNDLGTFSAPPSSGGGSASGTPVYFWPTNSPTSGYLELDYTPYSSVVENTYSIQVGTTLLSSHLTDLQIATTTIDAGNWYISSRSKVNNLSGSTKLHVDFILYHIDGTETVLFGGDSETFNSTDFKVYSGQLPESSFSCVSTDRIGVKLYAINSGGSTKTLTTSLGLGIPTFFSTPLRIRHSSLRDKNGESSFQHVTTDQILTWTNTSVNNTGDETSTTIKNKLGITTLSGSNTGDNAVNSLYSGIVSFPGFGTTHALAAYGDHNHSGVYEVPLTFSTGLTRTGNTITNNITQYTDVLARSAQTNSSIITALGYTPWYSGNHPTTVAGYGITDAVTGTPWTSMGYLTGITSGQVTTALGYTPKPTFTENTAFNKNFGTTTGTVLEGRTFGTAANSSIGDFIQNNNTSAQSANLWISGNIKTNSNILLNSDNVINYNSSVDDLYRIYKLSGSPTSRFESGGVFAFNNAATFASTVNATGFMLNGNNLTSNLSTNYIPKWNGSSFVNSLLSDDGGKLNISNNSPRLDLNTFSDSGKGGGIISDNDGVTLYSKSSYPSLKLGLSTNSGTTITASLSIDYGGNVSIPSTTPSTSPTTGALVVGGGVGVGGGIYSSNNIITDANVNGDVAHFNEFVKSGGTSSQFLKANGSVDATNYQPAITLTTNGTSGAATFSGGTLNVPNYGTNFCSGTYSPTITLLGGISSYTNIHAEYFKIGNVVHVSFGGFLTGTTSASESLQITLPFPCSAGHVYGVGSISNSDGTGKTDVYISENIAFISMSVVSGVSTDSFNVELTYVSQ